MFVRQLRHIALVVSLLLGVALTGCTKDNLPDYGDGDGVFAGGEKHYALSLAISLDKLDANASTRAGYGVLDEFDSQNGEGNEDYVDIDNIRVLFFDMNNIFIFEPKLEEGEFDIVPATSGNSREWYIRFGQELLEKKPTSIKTADGEPISFWEMLTMSTEGMKAPKYSNLTERDFGFKVAVLVNYPDKLQFKLFDENSPEPLPIGHFAHCFYDDIYSIASNSAYKHLVVWNDEKTKGNMGIYQVWVNAHHPKADMPPYSSNAEKFIRGEAYTITKEDIYTGTMKSTTYYPNNTEGAPFDLTRIEVVGNGAKTNTYFYKNIWRIWNFSNGNAVKYNASTAFATAWTKRFNDWVKDNWNIDTSGNDFTAFGAKLNDGFANFMDRSDEVYNAPYGLDFTVDLNVAENKLPKYYSSGYFNVPNIDRVETFKAGEAFVGNNRFHFKAYADGTLNIKVKIPGQGLVGVHVGKYNSNPKNDEERRTNYSRRTVYAKNDATSSDGDLLTISQEVVVDIDPIDVYICALDGTVQFFEIEFIEDRYIYDTDRIGILPDAENAIAMFGLQEYKPIGDYWLPGTMFNLSTFSGMHPSGYDHKQVSLLRSVAKVELLVPKTFPKPSHVYMRSMNQSARCNPIDIYTPTDRIWADVDQEIEDIRDHGPIFGSGTNSDDHDLQNQEYWNNTAWFYGTWLLPEKDGGIDWRFNGLVEDVTQDANFVIPERFYNSPHVFNSRIDRSDYVRFVEVDGGSDYYKYILYVPDKNIDDANDTAELNTSRPKVAHIELRFNGMNSDFNLDDNGAYRIYFTSNGNYYADKGGIGRDNYEDKGDDKAHEGATYEWNREVLKEHWPIVRNHIYRFTLRGLNQGDVQFEVVNPAQCNVNIPAFE